MRHRSYYVLGLCVGLLALNGCAKQAPPQMQASSVQTTILQPHTVTESSDYLASMISRKSITMQPRVDAQISQINVVAGDRVRAGQILMRLDATQQQAALTGLKAAQQTAQADLSNAQKSLVAYQANRTSAEAALAYARQQYERYETLYSQNSTSKQQFDQASTQYDQAKAALKQADAQILAQKAAIAHSASAVNQAKANISGQGSLLGYYTITAPFDGIVGDIPVKVGNYVSNQTNLLTITNDKTLEINVAVPIEKASQLHSGMDIEVDDTDGKSIGTAKVFFIAPNTAADSQTILLKARFDNGGGSVRADQNIRARVIWQTHPGLTLPVLAVVHNANLSFVYEPGKGPHNQTVAKMVPIDVGEIVGADYVIKGGLRQGDEVITSGVQSLGPNMPIKVVH